MAEREQAPSRLSRVSWIWRIALFVAIFVACLAALQAAALLVPATRDALLAFVHGTFTPTGLLVSEAVNLAAAIVALTAMATLEGRTLQDFGIPLRRRLLRRILQGGLLGVAFSLALYALVWAEGAFTIHGLALTGAAAFQFGVLWIAATLAVGVFEESVFRGYLQATLSRAWGFWPTAVVASAIFGAFHLALTPGVTIAGAGASAAAGLLYSVCLWRTGDIWMAVGLHASADFMETFVFAPTEGGITASHTLFQSALHGPVWLTGGSAGPEASVNGLVVSLLFFTLIRLAPRKAAPPDSRHADSRTALPTARHF